MLSNSAKFALEEWSVTGGNFELYFELSLDQAGNWI